MARPLERIPTRYVPAGPTGMGESGGGTAVHMSTSTENWTGSSQSKILGSRVRRVVPDLRRMRDLREAERRPARPRGISVWGRTSRGPLVSPAACEGMPGKQRGTGDRRPETGRVGVRVVGQRRRNLTVRRPQANLSG